MIFLKNDDKRTKQQQRQNNIRTKILDELNTVMLIYERVILEQLYV